jgi:hypothetical protein
MVRGFAGIGTTVLNERAHSLSVMYAGGNGLISTASSTILYRACLLYLPTMLRIVTTIKRATGTVYYPSEITRFLIEFLLQKYL